MTSDINQILPTAIGALAFPNQISANAQNGTSAAASGANISVNLKNSLQITEALAANSVGKVDAKPKNQSVRIPKQSEPGFSAQSDKQEDEEPKGSVDTNKSYAKKPRNPNSDELDIVA